LPVELPILWQVPGALGDNTGILRDIGRGGGFVETANAQPLPAEGDVVLKVSPPGAEVAMPLSARVAWKGHPGGEHGFGVEWKARDAGGPRRIKELVRSSADACGRARPRTRVRPPRRIKELVRRIEALGF